MKFTTPVVYLTGLLSLSSASVIPRQSGPVGDVAGTALGVVNGLFTNIQQHTGSINSTASALQSGASSDINSASLNVQSDIKAITGLVSKAEGAIKGLAPGAGSQSGNLDLSNTLAGLVSEVDGTVAPLVNELGLPGVANLVHNLDGVLGGLLQTVGGVVDGLLDVLKPILGGLPLVGGLLNGLLGEGGLLGGGGQGGGLLGGSGGQGGGLLGGLLKA